MGLCEIPGFPVLRPVRDKGGEARRSKSSGPPTVGCPGILSVAAEAQFYRWDSGHKVDSKSLRLFSLVAASGEFC